MNTPNTFNPIEIIASKRVYTLSVDMLNFSYEYIHIMRDNKVISDKACAILAGLITQELSARGMGIERNINDLDNGLLDSIKDNNNND